MNSLLLYLLNVSFSILPFYLLYLICFRRFTFFNWNRWYIIGSLVVSALVPLISFRSETYQYLPVQELPFIPHPAVPVDQHQTAAIPAAISWLQVLLIIYAGGVLITTVSLIASLVRIVQMIVANAPVRERAHGYRIIKNSRITMNASFFGYIFLQPSLSTEEAFTVMMHEDAHARRYHTFDLLLLECFKILLWFHPALYHYKKLLQETHEFEVDRETALVTDKKTYAHLLLKIKSTHASPLINGYSSSGLSQRIKMLFAKRSKSAMKVLYLLVVPCVLVVSLYCSKKSVDIQTDAGEYRVFEKKELREVITSGQQLFTANCAACHKIDKDMTGPALAGLENRRTREWIYNFIRNNNEMLRAGDSTALKVYNDWGKTPMTIFPHLSNKDMDAMLAYIRSAAHSIQEELPKN